MIIDYAISGEEMDCVEKMFIRYIQIVIRGIKSDYFKKISKISRMEISIEDTPLPLKFNMHVENFLNMDLKNEILSMAIDELTDKQIFILERIYGHKYTEAEVGRMLRTSQQSVNFHKKYALKKLRNIMTEIGAVIHRF